MISIKKLIERNSEGLFQAALESYRSALHAMGESGVKACPPVGSKLQQGLMRLQEELSAQSGPEVLQETGEKVEAELDQWGCGAAEYFKQRASEVKELLVILAQTAEATGERDQRYTHQLDEFTGRLKAIADLHELAQIRDSLVKSAIDLKACAEAMAEESQKSLAQLRQDVSVYQARLDDAERLAGLDALTGLDNRRRVESAIELRISRRQAFSVLMLDLNGFKKLNDTHGHLAADEVLKQFAAELKSGFRATDVVGRWGGDEFLVVMDGGLAAASAHQARIARWVLGDYTVRTGDGSRKVTVSAAIGAAEWQPGDTMRSIVDRADAAMYQDKRNAGAARK
jgi:diguanylate cyclase (GGDEF)-like protein